MAQLADMGIAIPEEFRPEMALTGEWQTVSQRVIGEDEGDAPDKSISVGVRKRKHEGDEEDEDQETKMFVSKGWGSRIREYPGAQQEEEDLDALLESTKDITKPKPTASAKESSEDPEAPIKREDGEADPSSQLKKEEPSAVDQEPAPPVKSGADEVAPGVVFKKRKAKAMRK